MFYKTLEDSNRESNRVNSTYEIRHMEKSHPAKLSKGCPWKHTCPTASNCPAMPYENSMMDGDLDNNAKYDEEIMDRQYHMYPPRPHYEPRPYYPLKPHPYPLPYPRPFPYFFNYYQPSPIYPPYLQYPYYDEYEGYDEDYDY